MDKMVTNQPTANQDCRHTDHGGIVAGHRPLNHLGQDRLIDRDEFALRLAVGTSTLDRLRAAGKVGPRAVRIGGAVRFALAEVAAWLSTPAADGELHDADTWPAVWAAIQRQVAHR